MQDTIIITCALTGAGPRSKNPAQPITPQQIAQSGLEAAEAGAAILHVHVRDPRSGEFSGDLALYEETVGLIREQNKDVILNLTTGLGSGYYPKDPLLPCEPGPASHLWTPEKRVEHVLRPMQPLSFDRSDRCGRRYAGARRTRPVPHRTSGRSLPWKVKPAGLIGQSLWPMTLPFTSTFTRFDARTSL